MGFARAHKSYRRYRTALQSEVCSGRVAGPPCCWRARGPHSAQACPLRASRPRQPPPMLFNSFRFTLLFLPLTAGIYALLGARATHRVRQTWILICSVFFYAVGQTSNLPLLLASIVFNWAVARAMMSRPEAKARRILLGCGIGVDIGALFLFKYLNFLLHSLAFLFPAAHLDRKST